MQSRKKVFPFLAALLAVLAGAVLPAAAQPPASPVRYTEAVKSLARANPVSFMKGEPKTETGDNPLVLPLQKTTLVIPLSSMVDLEAEKKRLQKELDNVQNEVTRLEGRLQDEAFLTKAPTAVIEKEKQKLYTLNDRLEKLKQQSSRL